MQELSALTAVISGKIQSGESLTPASEPKKIQVPLWVNKLFLRMIATYGAEWSRDFTSEEHINAAKLEWFDTLREFDLFVIGRAMHNCKKIYPTFPPKVGEFYALAVQARQAAAEKARAAQSMAKALSKKPELHYALAQMQKIKSLLKNRR